MKTCIALLFCIGLLPAFSSIHAFSAPAIRAGITKEGPHLKEFMDYYRNGSLKRKTIVIYDNNGNEEKTITESYRKDGTRRYRSVMNTSDLLQYTKYDKQGNMKFERSYCYYSNGQLRSVETRRPNGERQTWTEPPPELSYGSYNQSK